MGGHRGSGASRLAWTASAIAHAVDEGRTDSAVHSLDDAIGVLHTIDAVRAQLQERAAMTSEPPGSHCYVAAGRLDAAKHAQVIR